MSTRVYCHITEGLYLRLSYIFICVAKNLFLSNVFYSFGDPPTNRMAVLTRHFHRAYTTSPPSRCLSGESAIIAAPHKNHPEIVAVIAIVRATSEASRPSSQCRIFGRRPCSFRPEQILSNSIKILTGQSYYGALGLANLSQGFPVSVLEYPGES